MLGGCPFHSLCTQVSRVLQTEKKDRKEDLRSAGQTDRVTERQNESRADSSTAVEIPRMTDLIRMPFSDFRYFREKFEEKKKKSPKKQDFHFEVAQI